MLSTLALLATSTSAVSASGMALGTVLYGAGFYALDALGVMGGSSTATTVPITPEEEALERQREQVAARGAAALQITDSLRDGALLAQSAAKDVVSESLDVAELLLQSTQNVRDAAVVLSEMSVQNDETQSRFETTVNTTASLCEALVADVHQMSPQIELLLQELVQKEQVILNLRSELANSINQVLIQDSAMKEIRGQLTPLVEMNQSQAAQLNTLQEQNAQLLRRVSDMTRELVDLLDGEPNEDTLTSTRRVATAGFFN